MLDDDLSDDARLARAVELLREDPSVEETEAMATSTAAEAIEILRELPAGPVRDSLIAFTTGLVVRTS